MIQNIICPVRPCAYAFLRRPNPTVIGRSMSSARRTIRLLIISDTHSDDHLKDVSPPLPRSGVILHCGDLTVASRADELERTLTMLRALDAPLKLVIPGNHDFNLAPGYWKWTREYGNASQHKTLDVGGVSAQAREAGAEDKENDADTKASWDLLRRAARHDGIFILPQGTHTFLVTPPAPRRSASARFRIFASPLTPRGGTWGFQYDRSNPIKWATLVPPLITTTKGVDSAVDVVMTHGPPWGIRDGKDLGMTETGCAGLLAAVERARPRVHCFGHIHKAWGAELIAWKREVVASDAGDERVAFRGPSAPTLGNLVDAQGSRVVASRTPSQDPAAFDGGEETVDPPPPGWVTQRHQVLPREEGGCCVVDISPEGEHAVEPGTQTLCVNASVELRASPPRRPWLVDVDLPVANKEDAAAAAETRGRLLL